METPKESLKHLPHAPGVYLYRSKNGELLYVGKAKDLKKRVSQYFQRNDAVGEKTRLLVSQIGSIETIKTASEFDAILLEAKLIHDLAPKYNVILKDDKSPLYILLTLREPLPRVLFVRRSDIPKKVYAADTIFGPFQSARVVRTIMRELRHTIPYCSEKMRDGRPCFYTHIGLCSPCPSVIEKMDDGFPKHEQTVQYRGNIFKLRDILSGKSRAVLSEMEKEMRAFAEKKEFEEAANTRNHIENLKRMLTRSFDPSVYIQNATALEAIFQSETNALQSILQRYVPTIASLHRVECIDISNTSGTRGTGSLVVLTDGTVDKSQYRKFHINSGQAPNDVAMIGEVVTRRFSHPEWPYPSLLVVDGGKGQVAAARAAIPSALEGSVPVIGIAKREEELVVPAGAGFKVIRIPLTSPALHLVQRIRDEAHRFAITYHKLLRRKSFLTSTK